jgi:hypothetical protein
VNRGTTDLSGGLPGVTPSPAPEIVECKIFLYSGSTWNGKKDALAIGTWYAKPLLATQDPKFDWWNTNYLDGRDFDTTFRSMQIPFGFKVTMHTPNNVFTYTSADIILNPQHKEYTVWMQVENMTNDKCPYKGQEGTDLSQCKTLKDLTMNCLGVDISTPCDDSIYNGNSPNKACLTYLYTNQSSQSFLGSAYRFVTDFSQTSKNGNVTTFCKDTGTDHPQNTTSHLYKLKTIPEVMSYLSYLFMKASGPLDVGKRDGDGGKRNTWKRCMGVPPDNCSYGNYADDAPQCNNASVPISGCKPPPPPPPSGDDQDWNDLNGIPDD